MPRYSRRVRAANPHILWAAVLFGTVLVAALAVSHVFMTLRDIISLDEQSHGYGKQQLVWANDDRTTEVILYGDSQDVVGLDPSSIMTLYNDTEWMRAVHVWGAQHRCRNRKAAEDYLLQYEGRHEAPQQNLGDS